jgi:hypothetical protein
VHDSGHIGADDSDDPVVGNCAHLSRLRGSTGIECKGRNWRS